MRQEQMPKLTLKQAGIVTIMLVMAMVIGISIGMAFLASNIKPSGSEGTGILKFTVTIGANTYGPQAGKLTSVVKVPARDVAGQMALVNGEYTKFSLNLDTFAISNLSVNGMVLYSSVVAQSPPVLEKELIITFDRETITLLRQGKNGVMKVKADDADFGGILDVSPDLKTAPQAIDVVYTLGAGFTHTGVQPSVGGNQLLIAGPLNGFEMSDPKNVEVSSLVSWGTGMSRWTIPSGGAVHTDLAGIREDNPKRIP